MMERVYLDYAATAPCDPEVVKAMAPYHAEIFGNPSSLHSFGREAKQALERSRASIASFLGAREDEIVFTSGGTESNNFALKGVAYANQKKGNHLITSAIEHHCVLEPCKFLESQGFAVTYIKPDKDGLIDPADVARAITDKTILISVMHANNEIGVIEPVEDIARIARAKGVFFHTDAVQTCGHLPLDVNALGVDLLSIAAHKFYGPKGVGALYIRKGTKISSYMQGGDQERRRRASTENTPGIVGMAKAVECARGTMQEEMRTLAEWRDRLIKGILENIPHVRLNGHPTKRLPNNANVSVEYVEGESMILKLDMEGIACSTGSACTSSSLEPSHVLTAIGVPVEIAHGSLRFTSGRYTKSNDIDRVLEVLPRIIKTLRAMSPLYKER